MNLLSLDKKGWQFCILVTLLSIIPYVLILTDSNDESPWLLLLMWIPAISAIILRLYHKDGLFKNLKWNPIKDLKWIFLAAFIPLAIEIVTVLILILSNTAGLKQDFIQFNDGLITLKGVGMLFGVQAQPWYLLVPNYLLSYFVGALLYSLIFAFGEEYGWRGYLQQFWARSNQIKGFLAIGIFWGLWHFPAVLAGHNYPSYPIIGAFILMPLLCSIFSTAFGVSFNRKSIIWVAVMFHGALNISTEVSNTALVDSSINEPMKDLIWTILWLITALLIYKTNKDKLIMRYETR